MQNIGKMIKSFLSFRNNEKINENITSENINENVLINNSEETAFELKNLIDFLIDSGYQDFIDIDKKAVKLYCKRSFTLTGTRNINEFSLLYQQLDNESFINVFDNLLKNNINILTVFKKEALYTNGFLLNNMTMDNRPILYYAMNGFKEVTTTENLEKGLKAVNKLESVIVEWKQEKINILYQRILLTQMIYYKIFGNFYNFFDVIDFYNFEQSFTNFYYQAMKVAKESALTYNAVFNAKEVPIFLKVKKERYNRIRLFKQPSQKVARAVRFAKAIDIELNLSGNINNEGLRNAFNEDSGLYNTTANNDYELLQEQVDFNAIFEGVYLDYAECIENEGYQILEDEHDVLQDIDVPLDEMESLQEFLNNSADRLQRHENYITKESARIASIGRLFNMDYKDIDNKLKTDKVVYNPTKKDYELVPRYDKQATALKVNVFSMETLEALSKLNISENED